MRRLPADPMDPSDFVLLGDYVPGIVQEIG